MKAKLAILLFFVIGFGIGAEALKCYREGIDDGEETCRRKDGAKCVRVLSKKEGGWISMGCAPSCDFLKSQISDFEDCKECDTDLCNDDKIVALELECYSSAQKKSVKCNPGEQCVTVKPTDGGAEERKCGKCEAGDKNCIACKENQCNTPPLMCQNTTNQPNVCPFPHKCFTVKKGARVVDKGCGHCERNDDKMHKVFKETCEECNEDDCNKEKTATLLNCYNTSDVVEQCTDLREVCCTHNIYGNHVGKSCSRCESGDKFFIFDNRVVSNITGCDKDKCNSEKISQIECYEGDYSYAPVKTCLHGYKCTVRMDGTTMGDVEWGCGFCKPGQENCNECGEAKCNDIKGNWPTCKSGAANGAGEFYQHNDCLEDLSGPKDMKISAPCFKQQVWGITYKECGGCGAFVHDVPKYTKPPMFPETNNKPVSNKCFECKTEGGTAPCNGGIVHSVASKAFWLLLLIGASVPWLVLPMMSAFIGF